MPGRECYHCKQWVAEGELHNCWTTTEWALTKDLSPELREAWERLRETAADFGEQRIYASLNSIMFSRKACYCFVRPKTKYLELCVFLGRTVTSPQVKRATPASRTKIAHLIRITHRDQVEAPITEWMHEAYEMSDALSARGPKRDETRTAAVPRGKPAKTAPRARAARTRKAATARPSARTGLATTAGRRRAGTGMTARRRAKR